MLTDERSPAGSVIARLQEGRAFIQNFVPLADSLEWHLGQRYLRDRGSKAFVADASPVPYVVNNDGTLSRFAAEVLFTNLVAEEKAGRPQHDLLVLELGIGVGLFARFFLDAFRQLCRDRAKDYYGRLRYIAADRSEQMLRDAAQHGIFANHPGRYRLCKIDAVHPYPDLQQEFVHSKLPERPFRAVFLNYLLDCLPSSVLEADDRGTRQLCVRTCLARGVELADYTCRSANDIRQLVGSSNELDQAELLGLYGLMSSQYAYLPVDLGQMPYGLFAADLLQRWPGRLLHNYGSLQCLEQALGLLEERGFILVNDYGPARSDPYHDPEHNRFSQATCIGVNFSLLKAYFSDGGRCHWVEPPDDRDAMHARLLGRQLGRETVDRFQELFNKASFQRLEEPQVRARECIRTGRLDTALSYYRAALDRQPANWRLMGEIAGFLQGPFGDCEAAIETLKVALSLNPNCSSALWNLLGDGLLTSGRVPEAKQAYHRALKINENDAQVHLRLAAIHSHQKDYAVALRHISEGLGLDQYGHHADGLLQKQQEILRELAGRRQREAVFAANRISTTAPILRGEGRSSVSGDGEA